MLCYLLVFSPFFLFDCLPIFWGAAVAQLVERATSDQEVPGSIPSVAARSLLVGSLSV